MRHIIKQGSFAFGRWRSVCSTGFLFSVRPQCWRTSIRTQADIYRGEWYFTALKVIFTPYSDISPIGIGCDLKLSRDSGPARVRAQTHDRTQRSFRTVCGHLHNNTGEGSRARRSCSSSSRAASKHAEGGGGHRTHRAFHRPDAVGHSAVGKATGVGRGIEVTLISPDFFHTLALGIHASGNHQRITRCTPTFHVNAPLQRTAERMQRNLARLAHALTSLPTCDLEDFKRLKP